MSEADAVARVDQPITIDRLVENLRALGISGGETVLCHSSMSAIGWVCGGPPAVVDALMEAIGADGTIVMPTHTTQYSDPAAWQHPPVPESWYPIIMEERPPYRPDITPSRGMGAIVECFRTYPDVVRSRHPLYSFAAWGADANAIIEDHPLEFPLGPESPIGAIYDRDGTVLMLGTGYSTNTSLHLGEHLADLDKGFETETAPILESGEKRLESFQVLSTSTADFETVGQAFDAEHAIDTATVGDATSRLIEQRSLVDFAASWFGVNR